MKITTRPPQPPEPTYVLELTKDQLVALGMLSFRHEVRSKGDGSATFYDLLPQDVHNAVRASVEDVTRVSKSHIAGVTLLTTDWDKNP